MKKVFLCALALMVFLAPFALAAQSERPLDPEAGTGWLVATLEGEEYEWAYTGFVAGIGEDTLVFEGPAGPLQIKLNKGLEAGVEMSPNGIKAADFTSESITSRGYYSVTKTTKEDVQSTVLLEKAGEEGIWQGVFTLTVTPTDRTVADVRPGILESLSFEDGSFCFRKE